MKPFSQAEHRATKAEGGWAAVSTEYAPVSPESDECPAIGARIWDDDGRRQSRPLVRTRAQLRRRLAAIELHHSGVHAHRGEARVAASRPSQLASDDVSHLVPKAMDGGHRPVTP